MAIKVKKGDTLTSIAKANNTTVQAIAKANGIKDVNKIIAGSVLKNPITTQPVKPKTQQATTTTKKKAEPVKTVTMKTGMSSTSTSPSTTKTPTTPKPTNPTVPPPVDGAVKPGTTTPPVTTPTTPTTPATPPLTMKDIQDMFNTSQSSLQKGYDERLASFERMMQEQADFQKKQYDDMMNRFRYTSVQVNPSSLNTNARDGIHLFDPGVGQGQTQQVQQPTQPVNTGGGYQMNDALFRYLNNMWNGGF